MTEQKNGFVSKKDWDKFGVKERKSTEKFTKWSITKPFAT